MTQKEFLQQCENEGIHLTEYQQKQFEDYAKLLVEWNEKMNLTAITEPGEIYEKHFFDCLLLHRVCNIEGELCDVGAGAGFPSVPLKIAFPSLKVTIIEPLQKRCRFLEVLVKELELQNVTILNARAEDVAVQSQKRYNIVSARAVANLRVLSELCIPLVQLHGTFAAMKGSNGMQEHEEATNAITTLGCQLTKSDEVQLSDGSLRVNLAYEKVRKTPKGYPRAYAKIKKQPL
ncbi:MAG: 16S rRNA (guanine(527)-N(7))-methyltransferase RsmG [Erysipelotrichaceae bacterium]|nr:16S rRNA (guanine(527)-N(7))-methyltransferase RsmG [Erysipelotrichaceae bacterium]